VEKIIGGENVHQAMIGKYNEIAEIISRFCDLTMILRRFVSARCLS
jgi:hypothetical protein